MNKKILEVINSIIENIVTRNSNKQCSYDCIYKEYSYCALFNDDTGWDKKKQVPLTLKKCRTLLKLKENKQ
jgi:hypothetical protein